MDTREVAKRLLQVIEDNSFQKKGFNVASVLEDGGSKLLRELRKRPELAELTERPLTSDQVAAWLLDIIDNSDFAGEGFSVIAAAAPDFALAKFIIEMLDEIYPLASPKYPKNGMRRQRLVRHLVVLAEDKSLNDFFMQLLKHFDFSAEDVCYCCLDGKTPISAAMDRDNFELVKMISTHYDWYLEDGEVRLGLIAYADNIRGKSREADEMADWLYSTIDGRIKTEQEKVLAEAKEHLEHVRRAEKWARSNIGRSDEADKIIRQILTATHRG